VQTVASAAARKPDGARQLAPPAHVGCVPERRMPQTALQGGQRQQKIGRKKQNNGFD
jgi:hypothetical protein